METILTRRSFGVRVGYPYGNQEQRARGDRWAMTQMGRNFRQRGYVWQPGKIAITTRDADSPAYRDDEAWQETTYAFTATLLDKAAAPLVRLVRWWVSYAASRAVHTRRIIDASIAGSRVAGLLIDAAVHLRQGENLHPDREIAKRIGHHPIDWSKRAR